MRAIPVSGGQGVALVPYAVARGSREAVETVVPLEGEHHEVAVVVELATHWRLRQGVCAAQAAEGRLIWRGWLLVRNVVLVGSDPRRATMLILYEFVVRCPWWSSAVTANRCPVGAPPASAVRSVVIRSLRGSRW